jgi:hypothetical protein
VSKLLNSKTIVNENPAKLFLLSKNILTFPEFPKTGVFGTVLKLSQNGEKWLFMCAETRFKIKVPKARAF